MIPWKVPRGKLTKAAGTAIVDVLQNVTTSIIKETNYDTSDALRDFMGGLLSNLAGDGFGELISKYGSRKLGRVLSDLGFDDKKIEEIFTCAGTTWKGKVDYSDIPDHRTVGPGEKFTTHKKDAIKAKNKEVNNGYLRSDENGTFLNPSKKGVNDPLGAEVDHIVPKSKGGDNSSKNAQVLSKEQNGKKSDK